MGADEGILGRVICVREEGRGYHGDNQNGYCGIDHS